MASIYLATLILYLIYPLPQYNGKTLEIESFGSQKYFVIFDSGISTYNEDFNLIKNYAITIKCSDKIILRKHIYKENIYIFILINNHLYIYDNNNEIIYNTEINNNNKKYSIWNIIPYNEDGKLNLVVDLMKEVSYWDSYGYNYHQYYYTFNIINKNLDYLYDKTYSFNSNFKLLKEKTNCQFMDASNFIHCIFYNRQKFFNLRSYIKNSEKKKYNQEGYINAEIFELFSSKSIHGDNNLYCSLYLIYNEDYYYPKIIGNLTYCMLCNEYYFFDECINIDFTREEGCSHIETYYFNETDKFILICKKFNEFILLIIDYHLKEAINRKIIHINCNDNSGYNGPFSLIYNSSRKYYDLITEYNFIKNINPKCSFYYDESLNETFYFNRTKNKTQNEFGNKEIIPENSHLIYNFSDDDDFNDLSEESSLVQSENYYSSYIFSDLMTNYIDRKTNKTDNLNEEVKIEKEITNKTKEDIINNIADIMNDKEIGKNYEIKGEDFTLIIKPTNSPPLPNTTHIEFNECEKILRQVNNISNSSILTFLQLEINNADDNALYNQIQYTTYDDQLKELDLSVCKDVKTQIHYMLKDDSNLDLTSVSKYKNMGVDVLNINDDFFTNLCYAFSSSDNDMILEDRIKYIFQNYSLCEEGCTYNNLDITQRSISCDCKIKGNISTVTNPLVFDSGKNPSFFDSNIGVSKCYNLVLSLNNKLNNMGFIIFCILIIVYIITIIIQIKRGIKPVCDFLFNEMVIYGYLNNDSPKFFENNIMKDTKVESSSAAGIKNIKVDLNIENTECLDKPKLSKFKKKKGKKKGKKKKQLSKAIQIKELDKSNNEKEITDNRASCKGLKILQKKTKKNKIIKSNNTKENINEDTNFGIIKINLNSDIKKYIPSDSNQSLHNYTFEEAIKYDRRNLFRILYIYLLSKQIIFRTFFQKSPLELFPLRFTLFIFMLSCDLALNALFYFNDNISKKYHYASNLFLFTFSNNITIIIYSTLISYFLLTLLSKLSNSSNAIRNIFRTEEEKLKNNKNYEINNNTKRQIFYEVENVLKKFKIKILVLLIIETILILFFWYFVTAFCHVYSSTQTSWLLDTFLSILSRLMIELIFGFLYAKLYCMAVSSGIKTFYKILFCIYNFS